MEMFPIEHFEGSEQQSRNSFFFNSMELRLCCSEPWTYALGLVIGFTYQNWCLLSPISEMLRTILRMNKPLTGMYVRIAMHF